MNPAIYLSLFLLFFILWTQKKREKQWITQYVNVKYRKGHTAMKEAAKQFIGKDCYIYLLSGEVAGTIRDVSDHAMLVETKTDTQLVNLDFVIRIREYPKNKNGKKKSIILD